VPARRCAIISVDEVDLDCSNKGLVFYLLSFRCKFIVPFDVHVIVIGIHRHRHEIGLFNEETGGRVCGVSRRAPTQHALCRQAADIKNS